MEASVEILVTLVAGTGLLLFLVFIISAIAYQNRKHTHLMNMQELKHEMETEILKSR